MALRKVSFAVEEYYHLYNRGVEKRVIFKDIQDYKQFMFLMYICNTKRSIVLRDIGEKFDRKETIVDIGAYCLMPNHFHILVKEKLDNGISLYMRKLLTAYSMYFNKKYERTGTLFEGVFKSSHVSRDNYLKYLYSYIHLNPTKLVDKNWRIKSKRKAKELFEYISTYPYSSLQEYLTGKFKVLTPQVFPKYFFTAINHKQELFEWLEFTP